MAQRTGALVFDELTDRYDIRFDLSDYYGGLHCGVTTFALTFPTTTGACIAATVWKYS